MLCLLVLGLMKMEGKIFIIQIIKEKIRFLKNISILVQIVANGQIEEFK